MCMAKAPAPPPPVAPPAPPTMMSGKVEATQNKQRAQTRAAVQGGPSSAMTGAGLTPQTPGASPVLGT